jgi:hypothetical protein
MMGEDRQRKSKSPLKQKQLEWGTLLSFAYSDLFCASFVEDPGFGNRETWGTLWTSVAD